MEVFQSGYIFVNDNENALFFLDNNVTSTVRYFSVISAPLDQGPLEVQSQLVPSFSHAFSVLQLIYEFLLNIWSAFVIFTIFVKNVPFSKTQ